MQRITLRPVEHGPCDVHAWETQGIAVRIILAMRRRGGVSVCRDCLERARLEAKRVVDARA
jgi:hypothetical protein